MKIRDCILVLVNSINESLPILIAFPVNSGKLPYPLAFNPVACLENCLLPHFQMEKIYYLPHTSSRQKLLLTLISKKERILILINLYTFYF